MKSKFIKFSVFLSLLTLASASNAVEVINAGMSQPQPSATNVTVPEVQPQNSVVAISAPAVTSKDVSKTNVEDSADSKITTKDPFAPINRKVYKFNKTVDALYLKPISMTYSKVMPKPIKSSVGNFFRNVGEVPNTINHIVQGQVKLASNNLMRLIVNSTFGLCGLFDMATPLGFPNKRTDFGQTLMVLGYKESRYLVLPIFGPSTVRDGAGLVANSFISVPTYLKPKWRNRYLAAQFVHNRAEMQDVVDVVKTAGVDEYALVRDGYLQRRQYLNNETAASNDVDAGSAGSVSAPVVLTGPPD